MRGATPPLEVPDEGASNQAARRKREERAMTRHSSNPRTLSRPRPRCAAALLAALLACLAPAHASRSMLAGAAVSRREALDANPAKPHRRALGAPVLATPARASASSLRTQPAPPHNLPANWVAIWAADEQAYFYYNTQSGYSVWELPGVPQPAASGVVPSPPPPQPPPTPPPPPTNTDSGETTASLQLPEGWEAVWDKESGEYYYYSDDGEETWEKPQYRPPPMMPPPGRAETPVDLPGGWVSVFDDEFKMYYYHNAATGESTWEKPAAEVQAGHDHANAGAPSSSGSAEDAGGGGGGSSGWVVLPILLLAGGGVAYLGQRKQKDKEDEAKDGAVLTTTTREGDESRCDDNWTVAEELVKLAFGMFFARVSWVIIKVTDSALLGHVSTAALAASSVGDLWMSSTGIFVYGSVLPTFVGNSLGAGARAHTHTHTCTHARTHAHARTGVYIYNGTCT
jgi:hypothetical protein